MYSSHLLPNTLLVWFIRKYARPKAQISDDLFCEREDLRQEWSIYKAKRHTQDLQMIERIEDAQEKALEELRLASPTLFDEAVKVGFDTRVKFIPVLWKIGL